jgi:drug/metabolite transporter (DMT)-like permease
MDSGLQNLRGATITGCTMRQAISQLTIALSTSPTFRYGVVYASFFVGGACFSIMSYASSHLDASIITLFAAIQPPITAVLEWIWEGKELGVKKIFGMICVGIGMLCFTYIKKDESRHHRHKKSGQCKRHSDGQLR